MNDHVGILGYGEVGRAIGQLYADVDGVETLPWDPRAGFGTKGIHDRLLWHVCVPSSALETVEAFQGAGIPLEATIIVHTSTRPGICRRLAEKYQSLVHAPIEGRHPRLGDDLRRWKMPVAGDDGPTRKEAVGVLRGIGIPAWDLGQPWEATELAKLWSTTWLGMVVLMDRELRMGLKALDCDPNFAATWNTLYNLLYDGQAMERPHIWDTPGPLGGHCIIPNAKLLAAQFQSKIAELVAVFGEQDYRTA